MSMGHYELRRRKARAKKFTDAIFTTRKLRKLTEEKLKLLGDLERALIRERDFPTRDIDTNFSIGAKAPEGSEE